MAACELISNFSMIDVGGKRHTTRRAVAAGTIHLGPNAFVKVRDKTLPKGDCFPMAEIAGVSGAKQCANLLPMCHPLATRSSLGILRTESRSTICESVL